MDETNNKETNEPVIQEKPKGNHLLGILGAILGGFIAAIPWVLVYVYGNMIFSALAILIAIGALKGYQIFKGRIDKTLPYTISIVSLLVVIITTLIIIPCLLIVQEGQQLTYDYFKFIYGDDKFSGAIIHDLIISIAFTALGISGVVANIHKQLKQSDKPLEKIDISSTLANPNAEANNPEVVTSVKGAFQKYEAMDKAHAIDKKTILDELETLKNGKQLFNTLRTQQIIRKSKGKYYFSEKAEQSGLYRFGLLFGKFILFLIVLLVVVFVTIFLTLDNSEPSDNNLGSIPEQTVSDSYTFDEVNLKVIIPNGLRFVTGSDLNYAFGTGSSDTFSFGAYKDNDALTGLITDVAGEQKEEYIEFVKSIYEKDKYKLVRDVKEETFSDLKFTTMEYTFNSNDVSYNDLCIMYFANDKVVFLEYSYLSKDSSRVRSSLNNLFEKVK